MRNENQTEVPNFGSIGIDDIQDLINLTFFYAQNTPKSFIQKVTSGFFSKKNSNRDADSSFLQESIILSITAKDLISNVLDAKSDIILGMTHHLTH